MVGTADHPGVVTFGHRTAGAAPAGATAIMIFRVVPTSAGLPTLVDVHATPGTVDGTPYDHPR